MRFLCRVNLELAGYEVVEAENGAQALEHAQSGDIDLVLLDVMLPDIGGHEVARRLEDSSGPAIAFLSARASHEDLRAGFELGAVDYITKPFDPIALAPRVGEILERIERGESERFRLARLAELEG
jgi:DNA-binding response OmpR family regulator